MTIIRGVDVVSRIKDKSTLNFICILFLKLIFYPTTFGNVEYLK